MKVLLTGGAGFIGSHVQTHLLARGDEVVVVDDLSGGLKRNLAADAVFYKLDVCDKALADVFRQHNFDAVVHLAGQTMVNVSVEQPFFDMSINIGGTLHVLELCRENNVGRFVFASTAAVYGDTESLPLKESDAPRPLSFYGLSKWTVESYLALYHRYFGLHYAALRFANVYGERQGDGGEGGVVSIFAKRAAQGKGVTVFGDGGQSRDFIYAGDVARAIGAALTANGDAACGIFNVSTNTQTSLNEMLRLLGEVAGRRIAAEYSAPRAGDIYRSCLGNEKIKATLGWEPAMDFREGLKRTYAYFAEGAKR